jgi:hypothetical protein
MLTELIKDNRVSKTKRDLLKYIYESLGPFRFQLTNDTVKCADKLGVPELYNFNYGFKQKKKEYKGFIKDLKEEFSYDLKSIIIFGSLAQGYYWRSEDLIVQNEPDENASIDRRVLYYSPLLDLFNYPWMSDVDLCLVGELELEEVKKVLLKSDYHFEHASIITKEDFTNCLRHFYKYPQSKAGDLAADFKIIVFEHEENKKVKELRKKLINLRSDGFETMIDYSLERLDNRINREEVLFSQATVIKALHQSFMINFDPMINLEVETINNYLGISKEYKEFINNFVYERAVNDMVSSNRIDKWHFLKKYRVSILDNF